MTKFKLVSHFKMIKVTSYSTQKFNLCYKKWNDIKWHAYDICTDYPQCINIYLTVNWTMNHKDIYKADSLNININKHSNHPPSILRQLPTSINKRISTLSSDKQTFEDAAPAYQNALGHSNFSRKLEYTRRMKHNDPAGIGSAMSFGWTPLSAKTLRQT